MEDLEIAHLAGAIPSTLSVGERQRVAIARALASRPRLILADEPTAALDPVLGRRVMSLFLRTLKETDAALVMVSHDVTLVREFGFREVPLSVSAGETGVTAVLDDGTSGGARS